jgi:hypothetical protein
MTREELYQKLEQAQELLCEVYEFANDNGLVDMRRLASMADTMIVDCYEEIECGETAKHFGDE